MSMWKKFKSLFSEENSGGVKMLSDMEKLWSVVEPSMGLLLVRCLSERQRLLEENEGLTEDVLYQQAFDYCCAQIDPMIQVPASVVPEELFAKWYGVYMRAGAFGSGCGGADQSVVDVAGVYALAAAVELGDEEMQRVVLEDIKSWVV